MPDGFESLNHRTLTEDLEVNELNFLIPLTHIAIYEINTKKYLTNQMDAIRFEFMPFQLLRGNGENRNHTCCNTGTGLYR